MLLAAGSFRSYRCISGFSLALTLTLAGCTTGRQNGGTVGSHSPDSTTKANTLRVVLIVEPSTLDPAKTPDLVTGELLMQCFEGLVRINEKNEVVPALAEKWEVSADGKTYTFHLRKGVTFHNGQPVTAADFKYSWERALSPKTASIVSPNYLGGIVGASEIVAGKRKDLPGVEVVDTQTLRVTLDKPRAYFLSMLTYPTDYVVCKSAVEKNGGVVDAKAFVGTGPYTLESYTPGSKIVLKAYPNYWEANPEIARIEMPVIKVQDTAYANFETGQADIIPSQIPLSRYAEDKKSGKFSREYRLLPTAAVDYLVMHPVKQPLFAKKEIRQAFAMAIDRQEMLKVAYKSVGEVADGMAPPLLPGAGASPPPIPYDPKKARELLAKAGYPGGKGFPTLTMMTLEHSPVWAGVCQIVRANLKDNLGINVEIQEREAGQYWDDQQKGAYEFYITGWIADYADPQDFLSTLFSSQSTINRVGYRNPQFDALCAGADAETDLSKRTALYSQANRILMEDVGVLPTCFPPRIALIHTHVQGWKANLSNLLPFHTVTRIGR